MLNRTKSYKKLCFADTGEELISKLQIAESLWDQTIGLIGRANLAQGTGISISPCNGIHTFGVRFPIDVLFLDRDGRVLKIVRGMAPYRIAGPVWGAHTVIESAAGSFSEDRCPLSTLLKIQSEGPDDTG